MLVLSRKVGEKIVIGDNVTITITKISGNRVSVGVEAPHDVHVVRGELQPLSGEFATDADVIPLSHFAYAGGGDEPMLRRAR